MSYYKVLGGYKFTNSNLPPYYFYIANRYHKLFNFGTCIILKDKDNKLYKLRLETTPQETFNPEFDDKNIDNSPSISHYTIKPCTKEYLGSISYEPLDKSKDTVFILEGADIHNHLFSFSKYGDNDNYNYTGKYKIYSDNWLKAPNANPYCTPFR